eukprot:sb/3466786/
MLVRNMNKISHTSHLYLPPLGEVAHTYKMDIPHSTSDAQFHPWDNFLAVSAFGSAQPVLFFKKADTTSEQTQRDPVPGSWVITLPLGYPIVDLTYSIMKMHSRTPKGYDRWNGAPSKNLKQLSTSYRSSFTDRRGERETTNCITCQVPPTRRKATCPGPDQYPHEPRIVPDTGHGSNIGRATGQLPTVQQPIETSKQPIRTRYLGHVTGHQPIRDQAANVKNNATLSPRNNTARRRLDFNMSMTGGWQEWQTFNSTSAFTATQGMQSPPRGVMSGGEASPRLQSDCESIASSTMSASRIRRKNGKLTPPSRPNPQPPPVCEM